MRMGYVGHLIASLGLDTKEFNAALNKANVQMKTVGMSMSRVGQGLSMVFRSLGGAAGIGLISIAVTGAVVAITRLIAKTKEITWQQRMWKDISEETSKEISTQVGKVKALTGLIENENISNGQRVEAIGKLKEIMPGYNGQLTKEGELINHNRLELDSYIESLKRKILIQAREEKYTSLIQQLDLLQSQLPTAINSYRKAMDDFNASLNQTTKGGGRVPGGMNPIEIKRSANALDEAKEGYYDLRKAIIEVSRVIKALEQDMGNVDYVGLGDLGTKPGKEPGTPSLKSPVYHSSETFNSLMTQIERDFPKMSDLVEQSTANLLEYSNAWNEAATAAGEALLQYEKHKNLAESLQSSFSEMIYATISGWQSLGDVIVRQIQRIASEILAKAAVWAIMNVLFPQSMIVQKGFNTFMGFGKGGIPGMADGGLAYGNTLAKVGDYAGAQSNPEVIAPLDKLQDLITPSKLHVVVEGKIKGKDIVLALRRYES